MNELWKNIYEKSQRFLNQYSVRHVHCDWCSYAGIAAIIIW